MSVEEKLKAVLRKETDATAYLNEVWESKVITSILSICKEEIAEACKKQWISVKDRLPESGTMALMYNGTVINGKYAIRFFVDGEYYDESGRSTEQIFTQEHFTHWMLLPNAPEL